MPHLIHIGNSLGVRIPKAIIMQLGLKESTELEFKVTQEGLIISPKRKAREGWIQAFETAKKKKEKLLMGDKIENQFDKDEWVW